MTAGAQKTPANPGLSIVTPAFNEERNLPALYSRLAAVLDGTGESWEWVIIDDHSTDGTYGALSELAARDPRVRGIRLARNSGSHVAILCGLKEARGNAAIVIAGDGEDPPKEIPRLLAAWRAGPAIVWAEKTRRTGRSHLDDLVSRAFHSLVRRASGLNNLTPLGSDFFLVSRPVIDAINPLGERNTNVIVLLAWIGFEQTVISYEKDARMAGKSGWTLGKKTRLALDSVFGFSLRPIHAISALGFLIAAAGFLYAAVVIANAIVGNPVEGWSSLMVVVLIVGGAQMVMLGILGEYIWRALDETRGRPRYVVERRTNQ